ncbi:MAG TPA: peptidylprolyl isomerase, partial [Candidatus Kapabacteria bacterium]|nr:peptidylprolyl isomerase [Candidatus Kapabacteria bacterium]
MKQWIIVALLIFGISFVSFAQKKKPTDYSNLVLATVGKENITYKQVERAFQKNMNRKHQKLSDLPKDSIIDFVNLYVNYRLKVQDAISRGFDKDSAVVDDIAQNRKLLAESFFFEKKLTEPTLEKWQKMREKEYKVAIIIAMIGMNNDTTAAFEKINNALNELQQGVPFEEVAKKYSDDPETARNGGVVRSYITVGRVNRILEEEIYKLKKGEYTKQPVKTNFGYFLIKALDESPRYNLRLRSIVLENKNNKLSDDEFRQKADSLVKIIRAGKVTFEAIAKEHSIDTRTAPYGGAVDGFYSRSSGLNNTQETYIPEIEDAIYNLKSGEITDPIFAQNYYHIFKVDSILPINIAAELDELRATYKRLYFSEDKIKFIEKLLQDYGFSKNEQSLDALLNVLDTTKTSLDPDWQASVTEPIRKQTLFSLRNENTTVGKFVDEIARSRELRGTPLNRDGLNNAIKKIVEARIIDFATSNLEKEYEEFNDLVKEFRDGILLFKVEALEVWDKMKFDSTLAKAYYDTTSMDLTRPVMYDISEIYFLQKADADSVLKQIRSGAISFDEAANKHTQRIGMRAKNGHHGLLPADRNQLAKIASERKLTPGSISEPIAFEQGYSIIKVNAIEDARRKTFEEAIPDIAPRIQDLIQKNLTEQWLNRL